METILNDFIIYVSKTFWNVNRCWQLAKKYQKLNKLSFASNQ